MISQPHGYVQYTAIHHLILCGTDISHVKPKIAIAKVNWAPNVEASKASACYTHYNINKKNTQKKNQTKKHEVEEQQVDFHIHQWCLESLWEMKEVQDRGSKNKNHTAAFQEVQKQVLN